MALLIHIIKDKVVVTSQEGGKVWRFKGQNFEVYAYFEENPATVKEVDFAKEGGSSVETRSAYAKALKELLYRVRAIWGESRTDCDDLVHDRRTSQILDNRRGGVEIGLPYNNQDPKEHNQIKNFLTLLLNLSGFISDEWIGNNYPEYTDSLRNIRRVLAWTYGKGTGAFFRCELIAGKKQLGIPFEVYHDPNVEPYYAARDKEGRIIGRGTGHGV